MPDEISTAEGTLPERSTGPDLSVVVPVFDEEPNLERLVHEILEALRPLKRRFELIVVDDGSRDGSRAILARLAREERSLTVVGLRRNYGQTTALQAGLDRARGDIVVTMDGDLQNDPRDIHRLLERIDRGADVVSGWRRQRQDDLLRTIPSRIANGMIRWITGVPIHDQGCSLKAYRREVVRQLDLYGDMHRFIAILTLPYGVRIDEIEVHHRPRVAGASKYGISRTLKVLIDLLSIKMLTTFRERPLRWFALLGAPFLLLAIAAGASSLFGPQGYVVFTTVAFLGATSFAGCLLLGLLAESVLASASPVHQRRVLAREWGPPA